MKINPNVEYSWLEFRRLPEIRSLNENEQQRRYYFYLESLSNEKQKQNKGDGPFLLLENGRFILLETSNRIKLDGLR